jgi:hypothetical protein
MKVLLVCVALLPVALCWVKEMENEGTYEGDMILSPDQEDEIKNGKLSFGSIRSRLWGHEIPYAFDPSIAREPRAVKAIEAAIADYHKYTCLRFKKWKGETAYLYFFKGRGCSSPVGRRGWKQTINLASGCWCRSTVIHEIAHSMGFYHEQSRPDRDDFLKIHLENVPRGKGHNFNKYSKNIIDSLGTPYDYHSVMHYSKTAFSMNGKMTMEPVDPYYNDLIGTGSGFSATDIDQFNKLYKCPPYTGQLPVVPTIECHDKSSYCEMFKLSRGCDNGYMKWKCPLTCGACKLDPPPTKNPPATQEPPVTQKPTVPVTTNAPNPTTIRFEPCVDKYPKCSSFLSNCKDPKQRNAMEYHCMKTCNFCDNRKFCYDTADCTNLKHRCTDKSFASKYCARTCRAC